jgi:23S rRNA (adenine1618-N6)-methyltransferase
MANQLHPRNQHQGEYNFQTLVKANPTLGEYVEIINGRETIDFSNNNAVYALNKGLLLSYYKVLFWDIPNTNLIPAIPGRADYIHHIADLLADDNEGTVPTGKNITLLDIGTGASLVYPLIAHGCYGWKAIATDIEPTSVKIAETLAKANKKPIKVILQKQPNYIFSGILDNHTVTITCCNPPFFTSKNQAEKANKRKWQNLKGSQEAHFNFAGTESELACDGGEKRFIMSMLTESADYKTQAQWFTCLVSDKSNLKNYETRAKALGALTFIVKPMSQGQKTSHIIAWRF